MFVVNEATAAAIRQAFHESGELSAVVELRRHFPAITDNAKARECVLAIAAWPETLPIPPAKPRRRSSAARRRSEGAE